MDLSLFLRFASAISVCITVSINTHGKRDLLWVASGSLLCIKFKSVRDNVLISGFDRDEIERSEQDVHVGELRVFSIFSQLDVASKVASWAGLQYNASKCASLHVDGKRHRTRPTAFTVQNAVMEINRDGDLYRHLGIPTGFSYGPTRKDIIEKMQTDIDKIDSSLLAPWQKVNAVNTFVVPQLSFHLRGGMMARKVLHKLDQKIKKCAKRWMNLPQRASCEPLYLSNQQGGVNMIPTKQLADICDVAHAVHLLGSNDPHIARTANAALREVVRKRVETLWAFPPV
uniref:Reverse transcriptase domain-containing protein n=1 Tax=Panagrellus redivivus TaxID=6233 RepID=A0A7E4VRK1_PANRE